MRRRHQSVNMTLAVKVSVPHQLLLQALLSLSCTNKRKEVTGGFNPLKRQMTSYSKRTIETNALIDTLLIQKPRYIGHCENVENIVTVR